MKSSKKLSLDQIDLDFLIDMVRQKLLTLKDPRSRSSGYTFHDLVMSAFAMFHFKYPSLNQFETQTTSEQVNLQNLFKISKLCSDAHMRNILDQIDPVVLESLYPQGYDLLKQLGVLKEYSTLRGYRVCSVDGVQHFSSKKVSCSSCLTKEHGNGSTTYHHNMLCAALVHPDQKEVFVMGTEPIKRVDGQTKNDCELNAAKRLLDQMGQQYGGEKLIFVEDTLYSNGPHLKQIKQHVNWEFIVNIKPKSNKTLFTAFEHRRQAGKVKYHEYKDQKGTIHRFWYSNNFPINNAHPELRVNVLMYEEQTKSGKIRTFSWATTIKLNKANLIKIMRIGRARWKIENETFNTLKNQGYQFNHNFGHGFKHLSTFLAYMMLLAFQVDQIFQKCSMAFNRIWKAAKTKVKLWNMARSIFSTTIIPSFKELYRKLAFEFSVQLE